MNIVVCGTGGVGGYFGVRLAQAGHKVTFIARGAHLKAIKEQGLHLESIQGDAYLFPALATDDPSTLSPPDLIIFATKTWQLKEAALSCQSIVGPDTMVLPLLNGVTHASVLSEVFGSASVLGGLCRIVSKIERPGRIKHMAITPEIIFGELNNDRSSRVLKLQTIFTEAGIQSKVPEHIHKAIWTKFLFITTISALGGLTRSSIGQMRSIPEVRNLLMGIAKEVLAVAQAQDIPLSEQTIQTTFQVIDDLPFDTTASLQRDVMEGRPSELEAQVGTVHRMGMAFGVPTPLSTFVYHSLLPQEHLARC